MIRATTCLAVLLCAAGARAGEREEMLRYFEVGQAAYEARLYSVAIDAFEEALRRLHDPALVFSIAQACRNQFYQSEDPRLLRRALELYHVYLDEVPAGGRRADAQHWIMELRTRARARGISEVETPAPPARTQLYVASRTPGAVARVDGGAPARVPVSVDVSPGKHVIEVEAAGHHAARTEWLALEGRLVIAQVDLAAQPARLEVRAPASAHVYLDGIHLGQAPLAARHVPAGEHTVAVARDGHHAVSRKVVLENGGAASIVIPELSITDQRVAAHWVLGAGGATALAGGVVAILTIRQEGLAEGLDPERHPGLFTSTTPYHEAVAARDELRTACFALLGGAAALLGSGALLYLLDVPELPPSAPVVSAFAPPRGGDLAP